jgi:serine/threonine protein kinase
MTVLSKQEDQLIVVGALLGGRYRLLRQIGCGGMGTVFEATDERVGRRVAVKVLRQLSHSSLPSTALSRFQREVFAAARLEHPNIVQVTDFASYPGEAAYLVMEYIAGASLDAFVGTQALEPMRAAFIATQMLSALSATHAASILHRDIKPANVMVLTQGPVRDFIKIVDFGIAKLDPADGAPLTEKGMMVGTPTYMSPEQVSGAVVDHRADIYGVGIALFFMLTGQRPFPMPVTPQLFQAVMHQKRPTVLSLNSRIPAPLAQIVERAMARDARDRFESAQAMMLALSPWSRQEVPFLDTQRATTSVLPVASMGDRVATQSVPPLGVPFAAPFAAAEVAGVGLAGVGPTGVGRQNADQNVSATGRPSVAPAYALLGMPPTHPTLPSASGMAGAGTPLNQGVRAYTAPPPSPINRAQGGSHVNTSRAGRNFSILGLVVSACVGLVVSLASVAYVLQREDEPTATLANRPIVAPPPSASASLPRSTDVRVVDSSSSVSNGGKASAAPPRTQRTSAVPSASIPPTAPPSPAPSASKLPTPPGLPEGARVLPMGPCRQNSDCGGLHEACTEGVCVCSAWFRRCDASSRHCTDVFADADNCGSCGTSCPADQRCVGGTRGGRATGICEACPVGEVLCGRGKCRDLMQSASNCGKCGNACSSGMQCREGFCKPL